MRVDAQAYVTHEHIAFPTPGHFDDVIGHVVAGENASARDAERLGLKTPGVQVLPDRRCFDGLVEVTDVIAPLASVRQEWVDPLRLGHRVESEHVRRDAEGDRGGQVPHSESNLVANPFEVVLGGPHENDDLTHGVDRHVSCQVRRQERKPPRGELQDERYVHGS